MQRAVAIRKGIGRISDIADVVVLDDDLRHRRRVTLRTAAGFSFLLDLADVPDLSDGDAVVLDDGRLVLVEAAPEALMEITCRDPRHLARLAWHVGNRHLAAEIGELSLRLRRDHVIAEMARGLGATVSDLVAPFHPERGAYHGAAKHDHPHDV